MAPPPMHSLGPIFLASSLLSWRLQTQARWAGRPEGPPHQGLASATLLPFSLQPLRPVAQLCVLREEKAGREDGQGMRFLRAALTMKGADGARYGETITRARISNPHPMLG